MKLLFKLLKQNVSIIQLLGFVVVNLIGGVIVLFGVQAYKDFDNLDEADEHLLSKGSVVITKSISSLNSLSGKPRVFSDEEIEAIKGFSSVASVGEFKTSNFEVTAKLMFDSRSGISTDLFLDAVPDEFIKNAYDVITSENFTWSASVDSDTVPLVLPRNYLNLYNFGYAASTGNPVISEKMLGSFPITLQIKRGRTVVKEYVGVVCGLTNKINTILVPWDFVTEANDTYSTGGNKRPTRLIITTDSKELDDSVLDFIEEKGYVIEGDSSQIKLQNFIYGILFIVIGIGFVFSLLAFFMLVISILLLIEKNKEKIINLYSMGYSVSQIARTYQLMSVVIDVVVWLVAAIATVLVYPSLSELLSTLSPDFVPASLIAVWLISLLLSVLFASMHCLVVYSQIRKICRCR